MTRAEFTMRMLLTHSDFPLLHKHLTTGETSERDYAFNQLLTLYRELYNLVKNFDEEQTYQSKLDETFTDYQHLLLSAEYPFKLNPFDIMEFYANSYLHN